MAKIMEKKFATNFVTFTMALTDITAPGVVTDRSMALSDLRRFRIRYNLNDVNDMLSNIFQNKCQHDLQVEA